MKPEWRLENARNASLRSPSHRFNHILVDPTVMAALCFFPRFRRGLKEAIGTACLIAPTCFDSDVLRLSVDLVEARMLTPAEGLAFVRFVNALPIRRRTPDPLSALQRALSSDLDIQTSTYLTTAIADRAAVLSFDQQIVAACRRMRVSRYIHTRRAQILAPR